MWALLVAAIVLLDRGRINGLISNERFLSIMLNQIKDIQLYVNGRAIESELNHINFLISFMNYSYLPNQGALCLLDVNYSNAELIITKMKEHDLIKNNGIKNSLAKKYENSLKSLKKGNKTSAINILEAAKNEINAQSGKGIDPTAANILIRYTDNLIAHINSTN